MKSFHNFIDRTGQCWLWNFRTRPVRPDPRSPGFRTGTGISYKIIDTWNLVVVVSSQWDITNRGDQISHRCIEVDRDRRPQIIRLKESVTFPWHTKRDLFRRVDV